MSARKLPLLPVSQTTIFPGMIVPMILPEGNLSKLVERTLSDESDLAVVIRRPDAKGAKAAAPRFFEYGVSAKVIKKINLPDNQISVLLSGLQRFRLERVEKRQGVEHAEVQYLPEVVEKGVELEALLRSAQGQFKKISKDNPLISEEVKVALVNIDGPGKLADFMASVLVKEIPDYQDLLRLSDVKTRLHRLLVMLKREQDVQDVQKQISDEINLKVSTAQREFYLQEQLKLIQKELGKGQDERDRVVDRFRKRLEGKKLGEEARGRIEDEFERLESVHEHSAEYSVAINYLDWVTSLPWGVFSKENFDLKGAKEILDRDHHGLKEVKQRILEFLAVRKLKGNSEGSILCLVGPPGTGKTSLGKSIARALGRKFFRFSAGGMRDEAEIKGHRRTYVAAMPGKVIQGLKRTGTQNPVLLIDEIDKLGSGVSGDPASALLEVLDPEQNPAFLDLYLDVPFDCSQIFFITTANSTETIPPALLDRMEIISLHGYTDSEKKQIARGHLIPKQLAKAGLHPRDLKISTKGLEFIIHRYARESGVRSLEKQIARICRRVAYRRATGKLECVAIHTPADVEKMLGTPYYTPETAATTPVSGVATGLAWTPYGGEVLQIESLSMGGKGGITLTGQLGNVMKESASIAYSWLRDRANELQLPKEFFENHHIHVHVPAGATPKDGPSAGVTMVASLYSLLSGKTVPKDVGMTGEITLTGRVIAVGGVKEKVLAARRAGIRRILLPKDNVKDLKNLDAELKRGMKFVPATTLDECVRHLFH